MRLLDYSSCAPNLQYPIFLKHSQVNYIFHWLKNKVFYYLIYFCYYLAYFCYYLQVLLHILVLFIYPIILFQLPFSFIYNTFSKKISVSANKLLPNRFLNLFWFFNLSRLVSGVTNSSACQLLTCVLVNFPCFTQNQFCYDSLLRLYIQNKN